MRTQKHGRRAWLDAFGIDLKKLAPLGAGTAPLGKLRSNLAESLGLSEETLVMIGCGDEHAACLGAGVARPGIVGDIAGTAEPVCAASPEPAFDPTRLVETHCHADPDLWLLENPGFVSGGNIRWFRTVRQKGDICRARPEAARSARFRSVDVPAQPDGRHGAHLE
jgi:sugar (pentulose or hexulose) kinase